jgi:hypothetical protein
MVLVVAISEEKQDGCGRPGSTNVFCGSVARSDQHQSCPGSREVVAKALDQRSALKGGHDTISLW